jgi:hypothetical protein
MENLEQKMLREIANDKITPKKYNFKVDSELFDSENEEFAENINLKLDYDPESVPLAEF